MTEPAVLILHARGTNRDHEAAAAVELAGGRPVIAPMTALLAGELRLRDHQMLVLPGGFSFGDDLGAGRLWAEALTGPLAEELSRFVERGRPVLGICNGFQALVKAGLLPALPGRGPGQATLTRNRSARFECRWVYLAPQPGSPCVFTRHLVEPIFCPVAHGEGRFVAASEEIAAAIEAGGQVALRYVERGGAPASWPANPNGSAGDVAGVCNPAGNVLGLMPHPEDHIFPLQHPHHTRGERSGLGLPLFEGGLRWAAEVA